MRDSSGQTFGGMTVMMHYFYSILTGTASEHPCHLRDGATRSDSVRNSHKNNTPVSVEWTELVMNRAEELRLNAEMQYCRKNIS